MDEHPFALDAPFGQGIVSPSGDAYLVWTFPDLYVRRFDANTREWAEVVVLEGDIDQYSLGMDTDEDGNVFVAWMNQAGMVRASRRDVASGTWSAPQDISMEMPSPGAEPLVLDVNAEGHALLVWSTPNRSMFASIHSPSDQTWSSPVQLNADGRWFQFDIAIDAQGNARVIWLRDEDFEDGMWWRRLSLYSRVYTFEEGWSDVIELVSDEGLVLPELAFNSTGGGVLLWHGRASREHATWGSTLLSSIASAVFDDAGNVSGIQRIDMPPESPPFDPDPYGHALSARDGRAITGWLRHWVYDDDHPLAVMVSRFTSTPQ
jgi:hypothetical protein